jgi:hypothetical protein
LYLLDRNELSGAYEAIEEVMVTGRYHTCFCLRQQHTFDCHEGDDQICGLLIVRRMSAM